MTPPRRRVWRDYVDIVLLFAGGAGTLWAATVLGLHNTRVAGLDDEARLSYFVNRLRTGLMTDVISWTATTPLIIVVAVAAAVALAQLHLRLALAILAFAGVTLRLAAQLREETLSRGIGTPKVPLTMPSAQTTAALVMALAVVLALPRMLRPLGSLAGGFVAGGVAQGVVAEQWQRPGDVVAAVGLVVAVASLAVVVSARHTHPPRTRAAGFDRAVGHPALATVGAAVAVWRWFAAGMQPTGGSQHHTYFWASVVGMGVLVGLGIGLVAVLADRHLLPRGWVWARRPEGSAA